MISNAIRQSPRPRWKQNSGGHEAKTRARKADGSPEPICRGCNDFVEVRLHTTCRENGSKCHRCSLPSDNQLAGPGRVRNWRNDDLYSMVRVLEFILMGTRCGRSELPVGVHGLINKTLSVHPSIRPSVHWSIGPSESAGIEKSPAVEVPAKALRWHDAVFRQRGQQLLLIPDRYTQLLRLFQLRTR